MKMTTSTRAKIEYNHALASALQMLIGWEDLPECFDRPTVDEQFTQLAAQYRIDRDELVAEYERVANGPSVCNAC